MHNQLFIFKEDVYGKITNANYMRLLQMCGIIETTVLELMATLFWIHHGKLGPVIFPATEEAMGMRKYNFQRSEYTEKVFTNCTRQNGVEDFIPVRQSEQFICA